MEKERKKNSKSKFFWVYSIALFSVAFILILFSAFTGVRYKDEQTEAQMLYQGAQSSVLNLTDENEALERENSENRREIETLTAKIDELEKNVADLTEENDAIQQANEDLLKVEGLYQNERYNDARELFETIDPSVLGENAQAKYEYIRKKLY